jgi:Protein of unknown function (DUF4089)
MTEPFDCATYIVQAAAALGMPLAPEDKADVIAAFAVLAKVAGPVMAFPLPEDLIAAAVFVPGQEERG